MKVYVLENGSYSDTHVVGVFSTGENAALAARIFHDDPTICEHDLDMAVDEMRRGCALYFVRLERATGNTLEVKVQESSYGAFSREVGEDVNMNLYTHCWADDEPHAVKIASERRRVFLALPQADPAVAGTD